MRSSRLLRATPSSSVPNVLSDGLRSNKLDDNFFRQPTTSTSYYDQALVHSYDPSVLLEMRMQHERDMIEEVRQNLPDIGEIPFSHIEYTRVATSRAHALRAEKYKTKIRNIYFGLNKNSALQSMTEAEISAIRFILLHLYVSEQRALKYTPLGLVPFNKPMAKGSATPQFSRKSSRSIQSQVRPPVRVGYSNDASAQTPTTSIDEDYQDFAEETAAPVQSARSRHFSMLLGNNISSTFADKPVDIEHGSRTAVAMPHDTLDVLTTPSNNTPSNIIKPPTDVNEATYAASNSFAAVSAVGASSLVWEAFNKAIESTARTGVAAANRARRKKKAALKIDSAGILTEVNAQTFEAALNTVVPYDPAALRRALISPQSQPTDTDAPVVEENDESFEARVMRLALSESAVNDKLERAAKPATEGRVWVSHLNDTMQDAAAAKLQRMVHSRLAMAKQLSLMKHMYERVRMPSHELAQDKKHFEAVVDSLMMTLPPHPVIAATEESVSSDAEIDSTAFLQQKRKNRRLVKDHLSLDVERERQDALESVPAPPTDAFVAFLENLHEFRRTSAAVSATPGIQMRSRDGYFVSPNRKDIVDRTLSTVLDSIYAAKNNAKARAAVENRKDRPQDRSSASVRDEKRTNRLKTTSTSTRAFSTAVHSLAHTLAFNDIQARAAAAASPIHTLLTGSADAVQREEALWRGYAPIYRARANYPATTHSKDFMPDSVSSNSVSLNSNPLGSAALEGRVEAHASALHGYTTPVETPSQNIIYSTIHAAEAHLENNMYDRYLQHHQAFSSNHSHTVSSIAPASSSLASSLVGLRNNHRVALAPAPTRAFSTAPFYLYDEDGEEGDGMDDLGASLDKANDLQQYYGDSLPYMSDATDLPADVNKEAYEKYLSDLRASSSAAAASSRAAHGGIVENQEEEEVVFPQGSIAYVHYLLMHHSNRFTDDGDRHYWMSVSEQVATYLNKKEYVAALEFINRANYPPRPGSIGVYNALLNSLLADGMFVEAQKLLEALEQVGIQPNIVTYNIMLSAYTRHGKDDHMALTLRHMSATRVSPDSVTYNILIGQRMREADHMSVKELVRKMRIQGVGLSTQVCNRLIWAYVRQQNLDAALKVFHFMYEEQARRDLYKRDRRELVKLYDALVEERKAMMAKDKSGWLRSCGAEIDLNSWIVDVKPDAHTITLLVRALQARVEKQERQLRTARLNCNKIAEHLLQGNIHTSHAATVVSIYQNERTRAETSLHTLISLCKGQLRLFYELRDQMQAKLSQEILSSLVKSFTFALPATKHALADVVQTAQRLQMPLIIPPAAAVVLTSAGMTSTSSMSGSMHADIARMDSNNLPPTLQQLEKRGAILTGSSERLFDIYIDKKGLFHINTMRNHLIKDSPQALAKSSNQIPEEATQTSYENLAAQTSASVTEAAAAAASVDASLASLIPTTASSTATATAADSDSATTTATSNDTVTSPEELSERVDKIFEHSEALQRREDSRRDALLAARSIAPEDVSSTRISPKTDKAASRASAEDVADADGDITPVDDSMLLEASPDASREQVDSEGIVEDAVSDETEDPLRRVNTQKMASLVSDDDFIPIEPTKQPTSQPTTILPSDDIITASSFPQQPPLQFNGEPRPMDLCAGVLSVVMKATGTKIHVQHTESSGRSLASYLATPEHLLRNSARTKKPTPATNNTNTTKPYLAAGMHPSCSINASQVQLGLLSRLSDPVSFISNARRVVVKPHQFSPYTQHSPVTITWGEAAPTDTIFAALSSLFFDAIERLNKGLSICDPVPLSPSAQPDASEDPSHARALLEQVFAIVALGTAGRIRAVIHTDTVPADSAWGLPSAWVRRHCVELFVTDPDGRVHVTRGDNADVLTKAFLLCQFPVGRGIDRSCIFSILTGLSRLQSALVQRAEQDLPSASETTRFAGKSPYELALESDQAIMNKFRTDKRYVLGEVTDLTVREEKLLRLFKLFSLRVKLTRTSGTNAPGQPAMQKVLAHIQALKTELYQGLSTERPLAQDSSTVDAIVTPELVAQLFKIHTLCEPTVASSKPEPLYALPADASDSVYDRMRDSAEQARLHFNTTLDADMEARLHINTAYVSALCSALPPAIETATALMGVHLMDNPEGYNINGVRKVDVQAQLRADPSLKHTSHAPLSVFDNVTPPPFLATLGPINWSALQRWSDEYRYDANKTRTEKADAATIMSTISMQPHAYMVVPATLDETQMPSAPAYTLLLQRLVRLRRSEEAQGLASVLETIIALDLEENIKMRRGEDATLDREEDPVVAAVERGNQRMQVALQIDSAAPFEEYPMIYSACVYTWKSARVYDHAIAVAEMMVARRGPVALTEKMYVDIVECCFEGAAIALDRERAKTKVQDTASAVMSGETPSASSASDVARSRDYLSAAHVLGDGYHWSSMDYVWKTLTLTRAYVTACRKSCQPPLLHVVARAVRLGVRHGLEEATIALMSELSPALFKHPTFAKNKVVAGMSTQPTVVDRMRQLLTAHQINVDTLFSTNSSPQAVRDTIDAISSLQNAMPTDTIFAAVQQQSNMPFTHLIARNTHSSPMQLGIAWALVAHEVLLQIQAGNVTSVALYRDPDFQSYLQTALSQDESNLATRYNHLDFSAMHIRSKLKDVFTDDDCVPTRRSITYRTAKHETMSPQALRATLAWVIWCWKQALFKGIGLAPKPRTPVEWLAVEHVAGRDAPQDVDYNPNSARQGDDEMTRGTIGYGGLRAHDIYQLHMREMCGDAAPAVSLAAGDELDDVLSLPMQMGVTRVEKPRSREPKARRVHTRGRGRVNAPSILEEIDNIPNMSADGAIVVKHAHHGVVLLSRMLEACNAMPFVFNSKTLLLYSQAFHAWKNAEADQLAARVVMNRNDSPSAMLHKVKSHVLKYNKPEIWHIMHMLRNKQDSAPGDVSADAAHPSALGDAATTSSSVLKGGFVGMSFQNTKIYENRNRDFAPLPQPDVKSLTDKMHEKDIFFPALETAYHVFYSVEKPYTVDQVLQMLKVCYSTLLELRLLYAQLGHFSLLEQQHSLVSPPLIEAEIDYMRVVEKATYRPRRYAMDMISRVLSLIANEGFVPLHMLDAFVTRADISELRSRKVALSTQPSTRNSGLKRIQWQNHGVAMDEYESVSIQEIFARVRLEQETLKRSVKWYKDYAKEKPETFVLRHFSRLRNGEKSQMETEWMEEYMLAEAEVVTGEAALRGEHTHAHVEDKGNVAPGASGNAEVKRERSNKSKPKQSNTHDSNRKN